MIKYKLIGANQELANGTLGRNTVYSGRNVHLCITHRICEPSAKPYENFFFCLSESSGLRTQTGKIHSDDDQLSIMDS